MSSDTCSEKPRSKVKPKNYLINVRRERDPPIRKRKKKQNYFDAEPKVNKAKRLQ